jgi:hypothetical protein
MGKAKEAKEKGEQLDLIDVAPKNAKAIIAEARLYKENSSKRISYLVKEKEHKHNILELVKAAKLQPLDGGKIKFEYDGVMISIEPRDELVKVKDKTESE